MPQYSRRAFATLAASAAVAPFALDRLSADLAAAQGAALTARALFDRIAAQIGVPWKADSVDGVKAGDPSATVTGIVTTALPTLAVLKQAVGAGANVVIASQPAFYAKADARTPPPRRGPNAPPAAAPAAPAEPPPADPVYTAKNAFIDAHSLVLYRLHDHWRLRQPDPRAHALGQAMGWAKHQAGADPRRYDVPALSVEALVAATAKALGANGGVRVVGDPTTRVRRIGVLPGSTPIQAALDLLPDVDAILAGEVREWESVEYARDVLDAGAKKALILVGRIVSEEPGMRACADWLRTLAPGVPVRHVAAGDPYWRPV